LIKSINSKVGAGKSIKEIELFDQLDVGGLPLEMSLSSKKGKADVKINLINFNEEVNDTIFSTEGHSPSKVK
jgi:hypothetical protein